MKNYSRLILVVRTTLASDGDSNHAFGSVCRFWSDRFVFGLKADLDSLKELCSKVFTEPSNHEVQCEPFGRWVVLIAGSINRVSGGNVDKPAVIEKNVMVHVPVTVKTKNSIFAALFSPYVWVDNPNSLIGGREVFGYAKSYGCLSIDSPDNDPATPKSFELATFGGNDTDPVWDWHKDFIRIHRAGKTPSGVSSIMDLVGGNCEAGDLLDEWSKTGVKEIFYKQVRDVHDDAAGESAQACFRQITTAEYVLDGAENAQLLDHIYEIRIGELDSHPIRKELGLESRQQSAGYRLKTNFKVEHGRVLLSG
jgi:hypothetical protein